ncbi:ABC transporter substrate-binding protein [Sodalis sp. RH22]|uniref:ABC transporter substrate-binding protein n=1 Tax=unclassified Sodalis (in: enterobacteria) TaxID=2636512 RepID=UPI0039B5A776
MKYASGCIVAATLLGLGISPLRAQEKLTHIRVGHMVALDMAPLFVAKESDCFTQQGLDVETMFFANPGDNNAALSGGAIDFSFLPFTLPFFAANSGVPIRVISAGGGWGVMEVVAQGKLGLHDMAELKRYIQQHPGHPLKIATLQGDTLELILDRQFAKSGIDPKSVELVYFNDLLAMVEAFRGGQVDILSHIKPYTTDMVVNKNASLLANNASTWSLNSPNTVVSVLDKTLTERGPVVKEFLSGLICGAKIINEHPDQAVSYLDKGHYFRVSSAVLSQALKSASAPISFTPDLKSIQSVVDDMSRLGYIKTGVRAEDIFRLDTIRGLEKQ